MKIRKNRKVSFKPDLRGFKLNNVVEGEKSLENSVTPRPKNRTDGICRLLKHPLMNSIVNLGRDKSVCKAQGFPCLYINM